MTTIPDGFSRGNFNGDISAGVSGGSGDLFLFDNFGDKAIWLENGIGGFLAGTNGVDLAFTGPSWHLAAIADFDSGTVRFLNSPGNNPDTANDLLWVNDNGDLALWQSTGQNANPFANSNQENLPNPGAGWHVASTSDFDGNGAADILFQHDLGNLAIWEFQSVNENNKLQGAPVIKPGGQLNVDQNPGATWHVVGTGDIDGPSTSPAGIVFQNSDTNDIAVWEHPTVTAGGQIHFDIQSNLPNPGAGWHVVGMGNTTEPFGLAGDDIVLQHDNGDIAIWQLQVVGNQVVREGPGGSDPAGFNLGNPGDGWHVVGVQDMNSDRRADLVLQNDNGAAAVWDNIQANGTHDGFDFNPDPNPSGHLDWHIV
jgi:serralysin